MTKYANLLCFLQKFFFFPTRLADLLSFLKAAELYYRTIFKYRSASYTDWQRRKKVEEGEKHEWNVKTLDNALHLVSVQHDIVISKRNWIPNHTPRALLPAITSSFASCFCLRYWQQLYLSTPFFFFFFFLIFSCCCCYCCPAWSLQHPLYQFSSVNPNCWAFFLKNQNLRLVVCASLSFLVSCVSFVLSFSETLKT